MSYRYKKRADVGNRTRDLCLTMAALYQLSYVGLALASYRRRTGGGGPAQIPGTTRAFVCDWRVSSDHPSRSARAVASGASSRMYGRA